MESYEDSFQLTAGADASKTFPKQCSNLKKGDFVVLKEKVCHLVEVVTSKPGKHGHAKVSRTGVVCLHFLNLILNKRWYQFIFVFKVRLTGLDVFTKKKYEDFFPASQNVNVPFISRKEYQVKIFAGLENRFWKTFSCFAFLAGFSFVRWLCYLVGYG